MEPFPPVYQDEVGHIRRIAIDTLQHRFHHASRLHCFRSFLVDYVHGLQQLQTIPLQGVGVDIVHKIQSSIVTKPSTRILRGASSFVD